MSQSVAKLRSARVSSQKARLVANQIRGKKVERIRIGKNPIYYVMIYLQKVGLLKILLMVQN